MKAVSAVLNGRKRRYPKEPLSQSKSDVIVATEDMSEEQKAVLTDQLFANLEEMQHQFELTHDVQTGDGEYVVRVAPEDTASLLSDRYFYDLQYCRTHCLYDGIIKILCLC